MQCPDTWEALREGLHRLHRDPAAVNVVQMNQVELLFGDRLKLCDRPAVPPVGEVGKGFQRKQEALPRPWQVRHALRQIAAVLPDPQRGLDSDPRQLLKQLASRPIRARAVIPKAEMQDAHATFSLSSFGNLKENSNKWSLLVTSLAIMTKVSGQ